MYDWQSGMEGKEQMFSVFTTEKLYSLKRASFVFWEELFIMHVVCFIHAFMNGICGIY